MFKFLRNLKKKKPNEEINLPPEYTIVEVFLKNGKVERFEAVPNLTVVTPANGAWVVIDLTTKVHIYNWDTVAKINYTYIRKT